MKDERYLELERNPKAALTDDEIAEGWHFCEEWDGMLINDKWPEAEVCLCSKSITSERVR